MSEQVKCLIIGSGPAGYSASIYTSRANLSTVLYEGLQPGGQLTITAKVENFPGYPNGISGIAMMQDLKKQALRFGADVRSGIVTTCNLLQKPYNVTIDNKYIIESDTLIIATGATPKYLGLPEEQKYFGKGVSTCAVCDGFFYRKKIVAVVGGGDSACEEATYLAGLAGKVYLIVRKSFMKASQIMQNRVLTHPNIEVLFNTNTIGLFGKEYVEGVHLVKFINQPNEERFDIAIDGFFLAIGHTPNSNIFKSWLPVDENGFIKTKLGTTRTLIPGVFAAGDVADSTYRQAVIAAGTGCIAAIEATRYLKRG